MCKSEVYNANSVHSASKLAYCESRKKQTYTFHALESFKSVVPVCIISGVEFDFCHQFM
jgi:hypothetical protein